LWWCTSIIQSNLDSILNAFISIADSSNNLIGNKDVDLQDLKAKYKDMFSDKESFILNQKQELQESYSNLVLAQNENKEYESKLSNIKLKDKNLIVDNSNKIQRFARRAWEEEDYFKNY
jgi:hypothetical protein